MAAREGVEKFGGNGQCRWGALLCDNLNKFIVYALTSNLVDITANLKTTSSGLYKEVMGSKEKLFFPNAVNPARR